MDGIEQVSLTEICPDRSQLVSEDGKNTKSVLCQRCGSKVLCPGTALFAEKEVRIKQLFFWCINQLFICCINHLFIFYDSVILSHTFLFCGDVIMSVKLIRMLPVSIGNLPRVKH